MRCRTGLPISNVQLEIVDPNGQPVAHDGKATGEVVVRAPWLTQGYFKDEEKSRELWEGGWLHTGDIGYIDEEGYLQITDRLKDVIKTGGEWISSLELEDIISQHPGVSEVAVIGVRDAKWGERPMALVVPKRAGRPLNVEDIRATIQRQVEKGHPAQIRHAGENPDRRPDRQDQRRQDQQKTAAPGFYLIGSGRAAVPRQDS